MKKLIRRAGKVVLDTAYVLIDDQIYTIDNDRLAEQIKTFQDRIHKDDKICFYLDNAENIKNISFLNVILREEKIPVEPMF